MINVDDLNAKLFMHVVRCARMGPDGAWILTLDEPHDTELIQKAFMSELLRCWLTPAGENQRDGAIDDHINNTTTDPPDTGFMP